MHFLVKVPPKDWTPSPCQNQSDGSPRDGHRQRVLLCSNRPRGHPARIGARALTPGLAKPVGSSATRSSGALSLATSQMPLHARPSLSGTLDANRVSRGQHAISACSIIQATTAACAQSASAHDSGTHGYQQKASPEFRRCRYRPKPPFCYVCERISDHASCQAPQAHPVTAAISP